MGFHLNVGGATPFFTDVPIKPSCTISGVQFYVSDAIIDLWPFKYFLTKHLYGEWARLSSDFTNFLTVGRGAKNIGPL